MKFALLALGLLIASHSATAQPLKTPVPALISESGPVSAERSGAFNGTVVDYRVSIDETLVNGPRGAPAGVIVSTSYRRTNINDPSKRPVVFITAGGPGAASMNWHFKGVGPKIAIGPGKLADNPLSPLDAVDMVFIDPVGTGWSTVLPTEAGTTFWNTTADAQSVIDVIKDWLKRNGREASPRYVVGGSYSSKRTALIAIMGKSLNLDGIILESNMGTPEDQNLAAAQLLPTFAVAAAYHGKVAAQGRSSKEIYKEAWRFALSEYLPALQKGAALSGAERDRTAREVSRRIGLPADLVAQRNLRIDGADFMFGVLGNGQRIGLLDTRAKGDIAVYSTRFGPYSDPSYDLTLGGPSGVYAAGISKLPPTMMELYARELGYRTPRPYNNLNLEMLFTFQHEVPTNEYAILRATEALREQPKLRVLAMGGIYDLTTPLGAALYSADVAKMGDRIKLEIFESGHDVYVGEKNLRQFVAALKAFTQPLVTASR